MINYLLPERGAVVQQQGHPAAGVIGWWDKSKNTSGVAVTPASALTYSAVWAATRVISETVATLPCLLYRRLPGGGKERADSDNRFGMMHDSPNDVMTPYTYFETTTAHMVTHGNEYSKVVRMNGAPVALEVRLPDRVSVEQKDDVITYEVQDLGESIPFDDMLHVAGLGFDGLQGYSVVNQAAQSIGTAIAAEQQAGSMMGNGSQPAGALVHTQRLNKDQRSAFRKEWEEIHQGSDKAGNIAILHGGMSFVQTGMTNEDAQFLESRRFGVEEIARWFRLPPHMIGSLERATFSNIAEQSLDFAKYSIQPWLKRWEMGLNKKLLRAGERRELFFEFLMEALLRADIRTRNESYAIALQNGWHSINEIRERENLNPIPNGDEYVRQLNMAPIGQTIVPDTISQAWREQWEASINAIQKTAADMRAELIDDNTRVSNGVFTSLQRADERLSKALVTIHDQQDEMKRDLASYGKTQVNGTADHLKEAAWALVRDGRIAARQREAKTAKAAAKACEFAGQNFLAWLDTEYSQADWLTDRLLEPLAALQILGVDVSNIVSGHVESGREALLACTEGPKEGFAARVESRVTDWHKEINGGELPEN